MILPSNKQKKHYSKAAFGLLEVVISIAISGIILLGSMDVALKGLQVVRLNEIKDIANGILLRALEFSRSPSDQLYLTTQINDYSPHSFKIKQSGTLVGTNLLEATQSNDTNEISTCDNSTSDYQVTIGQSSAAAPYVICNQVLIQKLNSPVSSLQTDFKITSIVIYVYNKQSIKESLISYRSELKKT